MNKILLSIFILITGVSQAQKKEKDFGFKGGDVLLEGSLQFNSTKESVEVNEIRNTTMKKGFSLINPKAGLFINTKAVFGVELGFYREFEKFYGTGTENKANEFYAGIFGRYYFLEVGRRFKTYSELGMGLNNTRTTDNNLEEASKTTGYKGGISLGANYFISPKIAVNFSLSDLLQFSTSSPLGTKMSDAKTVESGVNIDIFDNFFSTVTFGVTFKL